jgi:lysophospholipase
MRRRLLAVLLLLSLSGCGDGGSRAPFAESRTPPSIAPRFYAPDGWAWGYVRVGDGPVQRYGVSATAVGPRATVLILPGYAEPAEKWFETIRRLNQDGYTVWLLERQGQGGSERLTPWRDLGHADSFDPDVAAVRALVNVVIRPKGDTPVIFLGHSAGALVALRAIEAGLPGDGLILSSPALDLKRLPRPKAQTLQIAGWARRLMLGWLKFPSEPGWRRDGPNGVAAGVTSDKIRGAVQQAWLTANPDLRMGAPSLGWIAAFFDAAQAAQADARRINTPVLMLGAGQDNQVLIAPQTKICQTIRDCREVRYSAGRHELHMESDALRDAWLNEIEGFIHARIAAKAQAHKAPPHAL